MNLIEFLCKKLMIR